MSDNKSVAPSFPTGIASRVLLWSLCLFLLAACHEHEHAHEHSDGHEHMEGESAPPGYVFMTPEQVQSIALKTDTLVRKNLTSHVKANGFLKVPNQNKATITSVYEGRIEQIRVTPGSVVRKGEVIATISHPDFLLLQEEFLGLAPRLVLAESDFQRQAQLVEGNAGARKNLQAAESELKSLRIRHSVLGRQLLLMGIDTATISTENLTSTIAVRSPLSGSVTEVLVNLGSNISAGTTIAEIIDNSQLHLDLFVYEKDLMHIRKGQSIDFILTNQPSSQYTAEVFSVGTSFENDSKAVAVHCVVKGDKNGLIEGMHVTAYFNITDQLVDAVPEDAIVQSEGVSYIFMEAKEPEEDHAHADEEEHLWFRRIPVRTGVSEFGHTEVTLLEAVHSDAVFVTKGAFFLLAKMTNAGEAHSH